MAAIDFPTATFDGQSFSAPNGVLYTWNATRSLWMTAGQVAPVLGDFYTSAVNVAGILTLNAWYTLQFPAATVGNSGNWYNPANSYRYTPPAGRYRLAVGMSSTYTAAASTTQLVFR